MWSFAEIQLTEAHRALTLENAPPTDVLLAAIIDKFRYACVSGTLRLGMEQCEQSRSDLRAVLQFHIGEVFRPILQLQVGISSPFSSRLENRAFLQRGTDCPSKNGDAVSACCGSRGAPSQSNVSRLWSSARSSFRYFRFSRSGSLESLVLRASHFTEWTYHRVAYRNGRISVIT